MANKPMNQNHLSELRALLTSGDALEIGVPVKHVCELLDDRDYHQDQVRQIERERECIETSNAHCSEGFKSHFETISSLTKLKKGWACGEEEPPSPQAAYAAFSVLYFADKKPMRIDPDVMGGIVLYFSGDRRKNCHFVCDNEGGVVFVYSNPQLELIKAFEMTFSQIKDPLLWKSISTFLWEGEGSVGLQWLTEK